MLAGPMLRSSRPESSSDESCACAPVDAAKMNKMKLDDVLVITHEFDENLALASRNLYHVGILEAQEINPLSLIGFDKVLMTSEAVKQIEEKLA